MNSFARLLLVLLAACPAGCSDDDGPVNAASGTPDLPEATAGMSGGAAAGPGRGGSAGTMTVVAQGEIRLGSTGARPAFEEAPSAPEGGTVLSESDLAADVVRSDSLVVSGDLVTSGGGPVRRIVSTSGSIVVSGSLRGGSLGGAPQGLSLEAPNGIIQISGSVRTSGAGATPNGKDAGPVRLRAGSIVVRGGVIAAGGAGRTRGGRGGEISLAATVGTYVYGEIDARGGSAAGETDGAAGGAAGAASFEGESVLDLTGTVLCRGGDARTSRNGAVGGDGGTVRMTGFMRARLFGRIDARGGAAAASGTGVGLQGGKGGRWIAGQPDPLQSLEIAGECILEGGPGDVSGGSGGSVVLRNWGGPMILEGDLSLGGGDSSAAPGEGGAISVVSDAVAGGLSVSGKVLARGGSAAGGVSSAPGGRGGRAEFFLAAAGNVGPLAFEADAIVDLGGGNSGGTGTAGDGGEILVVTPDARVLLSGTLAARGGEAAGGVGGRGGFVWIRSDEDADGVGGNVTIETTGLIDVSGGPGTVGGSARNNGEPGVGFFPDHQGKLAVLIDADSVNGGVTDGIIDNRGWVVARGGSAGGWGGDVMFHGAGTNGLQDPLSGNLDLAGHGTGAPGDFAGE